MGTTLHHSECEIFRRKQELRRRTRKATEALPQEEAQRRSRRVCRRLFELPVFSPARAVMLYAPMPGEVDISPFTRRCLDLGKRVCIPRVDWTNLRLIPAQIRNHELDLVSDRHGVQVPRDACPEVHVEDLDLVIVPGVAFDPSGARLGRGRGFYDRFLAEPLLRATTCGAGFALQLVPELPVEPHDARLRFIATEDRLIDTGADD